MQGDNREIVGWQHRFTGEPDAVKVARPVRERVVEKVPDNRATRQLSISLIRESKVRVLPESSIAPANGGFCLMASEFLRNNMLAG